MANQAKDKALRYLDRFSRTEKQVADYLSRKGFLQEEIRETIAYLREHQFVNDGSFAENFIHSRIRHGDGPVKIKQMLIQKGISRAIIEELLSKNYPAEIQLENVVELLKKRIALRGSERQKLYRFIASRGYSSYVIIQAFERIKHGNTKQTEK
jgi:SOS response regulatory protein OraA/RecX